MQLSRAPAAGPAPSRAPWQQQQQRRPGRAQRLARSSAVATSSPLPGLLEWAGGAKIATDKISLATDLQSDQPLLVAAADVGAGTTLLQLPESAWVTPASAAAQPAIGPLVTGLEPWLQLVLLLMAEHANPSSKLRPYLAALPTTLNSPLFWEDDELELLAGTQLLESLQGYRQFYAEQWEALEAGLFGAHRAAFPAEQFSYQAFAWAVASVRSRLHAPLDAEPIALVPLADALPHKRAGNVTWRLKAPGLFGKAQVLAVEATKPLRKGEALAMDYGPDKLDAALLLDHGVLDAAGLRGGYSLTLTLPEEDRYYADKLDILERSGLGASATFALARGAEPPVEMMAFLRLMQLQGNDCFLLESIFEAEVWSFMCEPVSAPNEAAVCSAMMAGAREALAGYSTSLDEDMALLRSGQLVPGSRQEMAVQVRLGEKEALDSVLGFFEGRAADLQALEFYQERRLKRLGLMDEEGKTTYDSFFRDGIA